MGNRKLVYFFFVGLNFLLTLSLPVTRICVNYSTVYNDMLVAKGLNCNQTTAVPPQRHSVICFFQINQMTQNFMGLVFFLIIVVLIVFIIVNVINFEITNFIHTQLGLDIYPDNYLVIHLVWPNQSSF